MQDSSESYRLHREACEERKSMNDDTRIIIEEYDAMCKELIDYLWRVWFAFDANDNRAMHIRKAIKAYNSRRCAAACGTPDPEITAYLDGEDK